MSKKNKKQYFDVPPVDLVQRLKSNEYLHENVVEDLLELYKRDKALASGIVTQLHTYAMPLLPCEIITRIDIKNSELGYLVKYTGDDTTDNTLEMELCMGTSPCKSLGNV